MDNTQGELNRRLAVMAILYFQRRTNPYSPEVSFLEIEKRLGFPRDYLEFTSWYLRTKGYIHRADSNDFAITAEGVDFVETQRVRIPILEQLLEAWEEGKPPQSADAKDERGGKSESDHRDLLSE